MYLSIGLGLPSTAFFSRCVSAGLRKRSRRLLQNETTPLSLLLDLPSASLTTTSRERLTSVFNGSKLSEATIRLNRYVPVESQNALFDAVSELFEASPDALQWRGVPKSPQLQAVCNLIYRHVDQGNSLRRHNIFSGDQLHAVLTQLMAAPNFRAYIDTRVKERFEGKSVSDAVEDALSFLRNYVGYTFGRQLMAVSRVQADVLSRYMRAAPGDYALLAAQADSLFMPAGLYALDEYGVPAEIANKLRAHWGDIESVDQGLRMPARQDLNKMELDPFERDLLINVRLSLPSVHSLTSAHRKPLRMPRAKRRPSTRLRGPKLSDDLIERICAAEYKS